MRGKGGATLREVADHGNHRAEMTGAETPDVKIDQRVNGRFDRRAHLVAISS